MELEDETHTLSSHSHTRVHTGSESSSRVEVGLVSATAVVHWVHRESSITRKGTGNQGKGDCCLGSRENWGKEREKKEARKENQQLKIQWLSDS